MMKVVMLALLFAGANAATINFNGIDTLYYPSSCQALADICEADAYCHGGATSLDVTVWGIMNDPDTYINAVKAGLWDLLKNHPTGGHDASYNMGADSSNWSQKQLNLVGFIQWFGWYQGTGGVYKDGLASYTNLLKCVIDAESALRTASSGVQLDSSLALGPYAAAAACFNDGVDFGTADAGTGTCKKDLDAMFTCFKADHPSLVLDIPIVTDGNGVVTTALTFGFPQTQDQACDAAKCANDQGSFLFNGALSGLFVSILGPFDLQVCIDGWMAEFQAFFMLWVSVVAAISMVVVALGLSITFYCVCGCTKKSAKDNQAMVEP